MRKLLFLGLVAACGGGDAVEVDQFGSELAKVSCAKQWECCTDAELTEMYMGITIDDMAIDSEEDCVQFANALLTGFLVAELQDSIAKGRIEYSADAAGGCIAAVKDLSCSEYGTIEGTQLEGCDPYITPLVDEGGACAQGYECTTKFCSGAMNSIGEDPVDGVCARLPGAGEACEDDCVDGFFCDFDTTTGDEICVAVRANGEECFLDEDCLSDNCDDTNVCADPGGMCTGR